MDEDRSVDLAAGRVEPEDPDPAGIGRAIAQHLRQRYLRSVTGVELVDEELELEIGEAVRADFHNRRE